MFSFISFNSFQKRTQTYLNESHYIPLFCPSALTFLTPPRGIGWDCTAMECSPLAQGSKCLGAQGKESKNKITGFVTPQTYREADSLYLCAHKVARIRRPSRRKATEVAIRRKSPKALTQRNGELLPLVTLFFDHTWLWNESPRLSKPLGRFFFTLPLDKEKASAPVEGNPKTFKSRSSIYQPTLLLFHRCRNRVVMSYYIFRVQYVNLLSPRRQTSNCVNIYKLRREISIQHLARFFSEHQSKRWFESTSLSITVWQSKHTSLVSTTPPLFTHTLYVIQWHRNKSTVYCNNKTLLCLFNHYLSWYIYY